jgi:pimeloyl-ACP methyl ester carboxylesterase
VLSLGLGAPLAPAEPDVAGVHQRYLEALNRGDATAASALLVEDALYEGVFGCLLRPCRGRDQIRQELDRQVLDHVRLSGLTFERYATTRTSWTTARFELRSDAVRAVGVERVLGTSTVGLRGQQIASIGFWFDRADPQTLRFVRTFLAQLPPPSVPVPPPANAPGRFVDVGGRLLYLTCSGAGSPTVILEGDLGAGDGATGGVWTSEPPSIQPTLATHTQVCSYDRAGEGLSDPGPTPRTGDMLVEDLHTLLQTAGIDGPYVLAAESFGGDLVQLYARRHADEVAGLVLLDPWPVDFDERTVAMLPPDAAAKYQAVTRQVAARAVGPDGPGGGTDIDATLAQLRAAGPLPQVPVRVLTGGMPPPPQDFPPGWPVEEWEQLRLDVQADVAHQVPDGTLDVVDTSGPAMTLYVPKLIGETIGQLVDALTSP